LVARRRIRLREVPVPPTMRFEDPRARAFISADMRLSVIQSRYKGKLCVSVSAFEESLDEGVVWAVLVALGLKPSRFKIEEPVNLLGLLPNHRLLFAWEK